MRVTTFALIALLAGTAACGDSPTEGPGDLSALVVGEYRAAEASGTLTLAVGGEQPIDWLDRGASVTLDLRDNGLTAGHIFLPAAGEDGEDIDGALDGTWAVDGDRLRLDHTFDTFLRDMRFTYVNGALRADQTFGDTRIVVVLVRR